MIENRPFIGLNYHGLGDDDLRTGRPLLVYFVASSLGAIGGVGIVALGNAVINAVEPMPPGPGDELGWGMMGGMIFLAVFISVGSFIVSCIFRCFSGRVTRRMHRLVATGGVVNGVIGMGVLLGCGVLEDHHLLLHVGIRTAWNIVILINLALPVMIGMLARKRGRQPAR